MEQSFTQSSDSINAIRPKHDPENSGGSHVQYQAPLQKILILHDTTHQNKNLQADVLCLVIAVATQAIVQRTFAALQMGKPVGVVAKSAILLPYVEAVQSQPTIHPTSKTGFPGQ